MHEVRTAWFSTACLILACGTPDAGTDGAAEVTSGDDASSSSTRGIVFPEDSS
jgi:hypothetical protein